MSVIIGLTGPTGSGKSTLTESAKKKGIQVIDCDFVARQATEKGTEGLKALVKAFGSDILSDDGSLNRKALAQKAFKTKESTNLLNSVILPYICELIINQITGEKVILDAPTLFESGLNSICNITVAVLSNKEIRLKRITKRDNIDKEFALLRINAGKSDDFYIKNADRYFYNNGTTEDFLNETEPFLKSVFERN